VKNRDRQKNAANLRTPAQRALWAAEGWIGLTQRHIIMTEYTIKETDRKLFLCFMVNNVHKFAIVKVQLQVTMQDRNPHWRSFDRKVILRTPSVAGMLARACSSLEKLQVTL